METYYLVEIIDGEEYNVYNGTEQECNDYAERNGIEDYYTTQNRFN